MTLGQPGFVRLLPSFELSNLQGVVRVGLTWSQRVHIDSRQTLILSEQPKQLAVRIDRGGTSLPAYSHELPVLPISRTYSTPTQRGSQDALRSRAQDSNVPRDQHSKQQES